NTMSVTEISLNLHSRSSTNSNTVLLRDARTQKKASSIIDESLEKQKREDTSRLKILLLGGADAGKSTILKQMRIQYMNGFKAEEMHSFKKYLRLNLFQICHVIAMGVHECIPKIFDFEKDILDRFSEGISWIVDIDVEKEVQFLNTFMKLDCVRSFMELHPNHPSLPDNAHYYIPHVSSLLAEDYIPTPEDILHLRIPTADVNEINFTFSTSAIRLIDVGGQKTYRKKWIHFFDGVAAVLFVASMAAYDQPLDAVDATIKPVLYKDLFTEDEIKKPKVVNRLRDSAHLFGEMLRSKFLTSAAFILFLNKVSKFPRFWP
ncbi:hypothetical protein PENTCL1PPCAC_9409, partial [Pristionchus entomophagus]